jgi:hypothetical protein
MDVKTCKQCGEIKPITQFRKYYGGRKGTYTRCMQCERINSREKYLSSKVDMRNNDEDIELAKIHRLYEYQRSIGLQPPTKQERRKALTADLDNMLDKYKSMSDAIQNNPVAVTLDLTGVPSELSMWLTKELTLEPDEYIDDVYERLVEKYRPCTGIDRETMMPVYDNTYKPVLDRILERFNDYEDSYYEGDE